MDIIQKVDEKYFLFSQMIMDFCGYCYTKEGKITSKDPSPNYDDIMVGGSLPAIFPKDTKATIQILCEERNEYVYAYQTKESITFYQDEPMKGLYDPWYKAFPILYFYYEPDGTSWFFWRGQAMIGLIEKGKFRVYRVSDFILDRAEKLDPKKQITIENMVEVLKNTEEEIPKRLPDEELKENIPGIFNFFTQ